jgi:hypothetical protein
MPLAGVTAAVMGGWICGVLISIWLGDTVDAGQGHWIAKLLSVGLASILGCCVGGSVRLAGALGKNRSPELGFHVGVVCSLIAVTSVFTTWNGKGVDLFLVVGLPLAIATPTVLLSLMSADKPFCEVHRRSLEETSLGRYPLEQEVALLQSLNQGEYRGLGALPHLASEEDGWCEVTAELCPDCSEGFVNLVTTMTVKGWNDHDLVSRLVHSRAIEAAKAKELVSGARLPTHCASSTETTSS